MTGHIPSVLDHGIFPFGMVTTEPAERLVVFIHGWKGSAHDTWGEFDSPPARDEWWRKADLLFAQYDSVGKSVTAIADQFREAIPDFYPRSSEQLLVRDGFAVRRDVGETYRELVLVGHSLGGLVVRRALIDSIDEWQFEQYEDSERPAILDATMRLFSPASAGFVPRGILGAIRETPFAWLLEMFLMAGGSYADLKRGSDVIRDTRRRTEAYGKADERARSLAASILWADPEKVVVTERYDTDARTRTMQGKTHRSVCKPTAEYAYPFEFVRTGGKRDDR